MVFCHCETPLFGGEAMASAPNMGAPQENATEGISIVRIADGKVVEAWNASDDLGLMQQLGVVPS